MREGHVLNLGPYSRWLTELRCLKLMMKNEDNEVVGHIVNCFPRFHHGQNLIRVRYLQFPFKLPVHSVVVRGKQLNKPYKLCKQSIAPWVAASPSATAKCKLSFSDTPEYISAQTDFLVISL